MVDDIKRDGFLPVRRDPNFTRVFADTTIATYLGRDVEFSLLAATTDPTFAYAGEEILGSIDLEGQGSFVETTRVRLSPGAALNLAFNLLFVLNENDLIKSADLSKDFKSLIEGKVPAHKIAPRSKAAKQQAKGK